MNVGFYKAKKRRVPIKNSIPPSIPAPTMVSVGPVSGRGVAVSSVEPEPPSTVTVTVHADVSLVPPLSSVSIDVAVNVPALLYV